MKKLLLAAILFLGAAPCWGQTLVQCANGVTGGGLTATATISPTNGNTLIAAVVGFTLGLTVSVTDSGANPFTADSSLVAPAGSSQDLLQYFHLSNVSGVTNVNATWSGGQFSILFACEVSGLVASPADVMDNTGNYVTTTTNWTAPAIVTLNAKDIIFGLGEVSDNGRTFSCTAPWTLPTNGTQTNGGMAAGICYQIVSVTGSYTPTGTINVADHISAIAASYKAPSTAQSGGIGGKAGAGGKAGIGYWQPIWRKREQFQ